MISITSPKSFLNLMGKQSKEVNQHSNEFFDEFVEQYDKFLREGYPALGNTSNWTKLFRTINHFSQSTEHKTGQAFVDFIKSNYKCNGDFVRLLAHLGDYAFRHGTWIK